MLPFVIGSDPISDDRAEKQVPRGRLSIKPTPVEANNSRASTEWGVFLGPKAFSLKVPDVIGHAEPEKKEDKPIRAGPRQHQQLENCCRHILGVLSGRGSRGFRWDAVRQCEGCRGCVSHMRAALRCRLVLEIVGQRPGLVVDLDGLDRPCHRRPTGLFLATRRLSDGEFGFDRCRLR